MTRIQAEYSGSERKLLIGNILQALFIIGAGIVLAALYHDSWERERPLLVMIATVIACYSLAILFIEHMQ